MNITTTTVMAQAYAKNMYLAGMGISATAALMSVPRAAQNNHNAVTRFLKGKTDNTNRSIKRV